jgi:large subunit ribosomal protein L22
MNRVTAKLSTYRQAPRKVRLLADLIRGQKTDVALKQLMVSTKRASDPVTKLLQSAIANAREQKMDLESLVVSEARVDKGKIMYRRRARARGRAMPIRKRTSHVFIALSGTEALVEKKAPVKKVAAKKAVAKKAPAKKVAAKKAPAAKKTTKTKVEKK